jgi:hypothetical protein
MLGLSMIDSLSAAREETLHVVPAEQIKSQASDTLEFLGEGTFRYLGLKLYIARFYLDPQVRDSRQDLMDSPKRLVIRYFRGIPKKALIEAAEKNIQNNPSVDFASLRERIDRLHEGYTDLRPGDVYELTYFDGTTSLFYNGNLRAKIEGADFASAYFGIWLSEYSISQKLRMALLGIPRS